MTKISLVFHLFFFLQSILCATTLEHGDRISTMSQTLHNGYKTSWADVPILQMPRFRIPSTSILHVNIPQPKDIDGKKAAHGKLVNPEEDVKVSLTFADHKLILPWTIVFDSEKRRSLQKLIITFSHDQFDVESIEYKTEYGPKIIRLDPDHPSVTAFEIVYQWKGVEGEDFAMGIFVMFIMCLVLLVLLTTFVCYFYETDALPKKISSSSYSSPQKSSSSSSSSHQGQSPQNGSTPLRARHHSGYRTPVK